MEPRIVTFGTVAEASLDLLTRHWLAASLVYGSLAAAMTVFEVWAVNTFPADDPEALFGNGELIGIVVGSLLAIPVLYHLTERIMVIEGLCAPGQPRRYGAMLGASILSSLATLIGFLFVIAPGFILLARWSIWAPLIIAKGQGASDSMHASWVATSKSQGALATVWLVVVLGYVALTAVHLMATGALDELSPLPSYSWAFVQEIGIGQVLGEALAMLTMFISIAAFRLLVGWNNDLDTVFA